MDFIIFKLTLTLRRDFPLYYKTLLERHKFGSVLNVPDGGTLLTKMIHDFVVLRMIGSEHEKRMITHFTEVLKSLGKTTNKH